MEDYGEFIVHAIKNTGVELRCSGGSFLLGLEDLSVRAKFTLDELRYELPIGFHKNYLKYLQ